MMRNGQPSDPPPILRRCLGTVLIGLTLAGAWSTGWHVAAGMWTPALRTGSAPAEDYLLLATIAIGLTITGWMSLTGLLWLVAIVPGRLGELARGLANRFTPGVMRRILTGLLGSTMMMVAASEAARAAPTTHLVDAGVAGSPARTAPLPDPGWSTPLKAAPVTPAPANPGQVRRHRGGPAPAAGSARAGGAWAGWHVRPGDTLWSIAAAQLPRDASPATIDALWRQWYRANRTLVGPHPDLIHPGQRLLNPNQSSIGGTP